MHSRLHRFASFFQNFLGGGPPNPHLQEGRPLPYPPPLGPSGLENPPPRLASGSATATELHVCILVSLAFIFFVLNFIHKYLDLSKRKFFSWLFYKYIRKDHVGACTRGHGQVDIYVKGVEIVDLIKNCPSTDTISVEHHKILLSEKEHRCVRLNVVVFRLKILNA